MQIRAAGAAEGGEGPADEGGGLCRGGQQALRREKGPADDGGGLCKGGQQALRRRAEGPADKGGGI